MCPVIQYPSAYPSYYSTCTNAACATLGDSKAGPSGPCTPIGTVLQCTYKRPCQLCTNVGRSPAHPALLSSAAKSYASRCNQRRRRGVTLPGLGFFFNSRDGASSRPHVVIEGGSALRAERPDDEEDDEVGSPPSGSGERSYRSFDARSTVGGSQLSPWNRLRRTSHWGCGGAWTGRAASW